MMRRRRLRWLDARLVQAYSPGVRALSIFLLLACLYGRVAVLHLRQGVVGGIYDGYENVWNDWWLHTALFRLHHNPFFTPYLEYPTGVSLRFHALDPLGGLLALPLTPLLGPVATMNLKFLLALVGCAFFAYLLLHDLTDSALAACAGGAVYAFANRQVLTDYSLGSQNYLMGTALLPLFLFFLLRAAGRTPWHRDGLAAVLLLLALAFTDWQYTLFAVLIAALYVLFTLGTLRRDAIPVLLRCATIGGIWALIVFPTLMWPMLREADHSPYLTVGDQASQHERALSAFVRPGTDNPGYFIAAVTIIGLVLLWRRPLACADRRSVAFWALVAGLASLISLGPRLKLTPGSRLTRIPLPATLWYRVPILNIARKPELFSTVAMLAFGVLFAFALRECFISVEHLVSRLWRSGSHFATGRMPDVLTMLLLIVTLLPFFATAGTVEADPPQWPPFYRDVLAKDHDSYAILELPVFAGRRGRYDGTYQAYQILHGKYRFGASLSREHTAANPQLFVKQATLFRDFFFLDDPKMIASYRPQTRDFLAPPDYRTVGLSLLNYYHVRYIILYLDALRAVDKEGNAIPVSPLDRARTQVHAVLGVGAQPVYQDALMEAYRVPEAPALAQPLFLDTGSTGWYAAEMTPDQMSYRWADTRDGSVAGLLVFNLSGAARAAQIQFTLFDYQGDRQVAILLNGANAASVHLASGASQDEVLAVNVPPGMSLITFATPEAPVPVQAGPRDSNDNRLLSFGVKQVHLSDK